MNVRIKAVAAAAAMVAASSALADIDISGNGMGFLSVLDPVSQTSYVRGLGVLFNDFGTGNRATAGFSTIVDSATASNPVRFVSEGDSVWDQFVAGKSAGQISGMVYDVLFIDSVGGTGADALRYLTTSNNLNFAPTGVQQSNARLSQFNIVTQYVQAVNLTLPDAPSASLPNSAIFANGDTAYWTNAKGDAWGGNAQNFKTTASLGTDVNFYYLTRSGTNNNAEAIAVQYGNALGAAKWNLAANGDLTFTAPVPEPSTYALFAIGALGVGFAARRKRNA